MRRVYLDNAATTRVAPEVVAAMAAAMWEHFGNPSSPHSAGHEAMKAVDDARSIIAGHLNCSVSEVVFTSGGTESDNLAIFGVAKALRQKGTHLITSAIEHQAVHKAVAELEQEGFTATYLKVDAQGRVAPEDVRAALRPDTMLISVMLVNNEVGTIEPIAEIARIAHEHGVLAHTDAVQALGKMPLDVRQLGVDLLSISAHKVHGPKGVGALYARSGVKLKPTVTGGHQEGGRRGGTENVPAIVGFGKAVECLEGRWEQTAARVRNLRDLLESGIRSRIDHVVINAGDTLRSPHIVNVSFRGIEASAVVKRLDRAGVCVSTGSACTSGSLKPSHVLRAMRVPKGLVEGSLRFSLSSDTTADEIEYTLDCLVESIEEERAIHPLYREKKPLPVSRSAGSAESTPSEKRPPVSQIPVVDEP